MRLPGKKRVVQAKRWVRSRITAGGLILGYHRVSEIADDVYSTCVRPDYFAEQMAVLRQLANPIPLDDLINGLKIGTVPPRAVVVTFDDGYADNLYQAKPILEKYEIPVTLYVATGYLGQRFWWDELVCLLLDNPGLPAGLSFKIANNDLSWRIPGDRDAGRHLLLREIYKWLLGLTAEQRRQAMEQLRHQIEETYSKSNCDSRAVTPDELREFSSDDLITIGAHSVTHPLLANLSKEAQRHEIEQSKRDLEALLGQPVNTFSYPNGSSNETTRALLHETGYTSACASYNGAAGPDTDLLTLPRFWIPDQSGNEFTKWLSRWL